VKLDPNYRNAYANLAISYYELGQSETMEQNLAMQKGDEAIEEALMQAPLSAEVHAARGFSR
jgi:hypothetical protein